MKINQTVTFKHGPESYHLSGRMSMGWTSTPRPDRVAFKMGSFQWHDELDQERPGVWFDFDLTMQALTA